MRFYEAVGQAASEGTAATVLTLPGEKEEGVYTNSFLAVRVGSADKFVDLATEAMRLWNQMNRDGQGGLRLVFDVEELSIGDRKAIQYSLDLAEADGAAVLPETRQAMEKLFGPGGKLRMLIAKVDEHTVLLAGATPEQVAAMLEQLDRKQRLDWQQPPFADVNRLLPNEADWRAFFSPHGYTMWKTRESAAIVGTEVIGGPIVKGFPVGIAGRHRRRCNQWRTLDGHRDAGRYDPRGRSLFAAEAPGPIATVVGRIAGTHVLLLLSSEPHC